MYCFSFLFFSFFLFFFLLFFVLYYLLFNIFLLTICTEQKVRVPTQVLQHQREIFRNLGNRVYLTKASGQRERA